MTPNQGLPLPCLMLVTNRALAGGVAALVTAVAAAVEGGVNAVQVREKDLPEDDQVALVGRLRTVIGGRATLIVNGSAAVARAGGADGVHLGERSPLPGVVVGATGKALLSGRSVHGRESAEAAVRDGAAYVVLGTIFPSRSHPGEETGGIDRVRAVAGSVSVPIIAIGGITAGNIASVVAAGAAGAAVISALLGQPDPRLAATVLWAALYAAWTDRQQRAGAGHAVTPV